MPELSFHIGETAPLPYAAVPTLRAPLQIVNAAADRIQSIQLNCQVQIEPLGRPYTAAEEARLLDLFGERERWARTMKPMLWTNSIVKVPAFENEMAAELLLPCTLDFDVAATKYFYGLKAGEINGTVMFSGTVFYMTADGATLMAPIPWDREARFRLPAETWQRAIDAHYMESVWLRLPRATFERLYLYKVARGLPLWEQVIAQLLERSEADEVREVLAAAGGAER